ncbi:MAG TPA: ATP-binding protein [Pyrinomonadaceae bacterium]|nr:ATP-binding protein [Pyrinomonadaceae bacterium]HMP64245.1 ATP-binding protein [Pyrinomonadaceae bacterium]
MQVTQPHIQDPSFGTRSDEASRTPLQCVIDATREAVLVSDAGMRIVAANRNARSQLTREGVGLVGKRLSEIVRDVSLHDAFRATLVEGRPSDIRIELIGGESRTYDVHIEPLLLEGARYAVSTFYDITSVERLERVRQEFLSNISHELRTPLTSILAFVETLEDGAIDDTENNRRFLNTIRRNAERMHGLISDILELSLIESGNISIEIKQVRVGHLVEEVFVSLAAKASEREIKLINQIDKSERVYADPMRLEQMITNLVDNAIKFNRRGGRVSVRHEHRSGRDIISVADTGEGIIPAHAHRIFERFYRVDRGRTRDVGGTGLGLAIVKHLARLHGGDVLVSSILGQGTTFTLEFPSIPVLTTQRQ